MRRRLPRDVRRDESGGFRNADQQAQVTGRPMEIRRLTTAHAAGYRAIMLQGYAQEPETFIATVPEREPLPLEWWACRVSDDPDSTQRVFGAFVEDRLIGVAGLRREQRPRTLHKSSLFGLFVLPQFRDRGIARALVEAVLEEARSMPATRVVRLTVTESNGAALRLYESCGFRPFGTEPMAVKMDERFVSLVHMWRLI